MSDDQTAAAAAAGDTTAAPELEKPTATATEGGGNLSELGNDAAAAAAAGPASWPEDWRNLLTGGDAAGMKLLERYPSVEDVYKRMLSQEQIIRRGAHKTLPTLPENPTEDQVAEYRKAVGVPETPDGYGLKFADDLKPTEADNEMLNGFIADMHRQNIPPGAAKAAFDWYQAQLGRAREEGIAAQQRQRHTNELTLRKEYGADYMRNLGLADEFLDGYPGLKAIVHPGSSVEVLRDVVALARASADEDALYGGDTHGGGKSLEDERKELLSIPYSNRTETQRARLEKIYSVLQDKQERLGRRSAA